MFKNKFIYCKCGCGSKIDHILHPSVIFSSVVCKYRWDQKRVDKTIKVKVPSNLYPDMVALFIDIHGSGTCSGNCSFEVGFRPDINNEKGGRDIFFVNSIRDKDGNRVSIELINNPNTKKMSSIKN